jgi:TrkA domain protein
MEGDIVEEEDLPGIGRSFTLRAERAEKVMVVIHHSGRRDLYVLEKGASEDDPTAVVSLTDDTARRLGAVLAGAYFKPAMVERIESLIGGLLIEWVTIRDDSPAAGHTIADLEIRRRTRMTVAAIARADGTSVIAPEPREALHAGDQLVVIGRPEDFDRLRALVIG